LKSVLGQPAANALRHAPRFGIGKALHAVAPLNFERYILRPALSALAEKLVKGRHGLKGGIYLKTRFIAAVGGMVS
jgi:hypothetical protein